MFRKGEVARIQNNGNFGIGTTDPASSLDVVGEIRGDELTISDLAIAGAVESTTGGFIFPDGTTQITAATGGTSLWQAAGNDIFYNDGNVGIGTMDPNTPLHIVGPDNNGIVAGLTIVSVEGPQTMLIDGNEIDSISADLNLNLNTKMSVVIALGGGNVGIGKQNPTCALDVQGDICSTGLIGARSDGRFKTHVECLPHSLSSLLKLRGVEFQWRQDEFPEYGFSDQRQVGFVAQEVLEVFPQVVSIGDDGFYSVDYGRLVPVLVEAVKELDATLNDRDNVVANQGRQIKDLTARLIRMEARIAQVTGVGTRSVE